MPLYDITLPESQALTILETLLEVYSETNKIAIDTETNGKEIRDGRGYCVGVSLAWEGENALYLPFRHVDEESNYDLARFLPVLQRILDKFTIIFHNTAFDLISLRTLGCDTDKVKFMDTMLLAHLLDEELLSYKLDYLGNLYLGMGKLRSFEFTNWVKWYGWDQLVVELMYDYAMFDAYLTYKLYQFLAPKLKTEKLEKVWARKCKFVRLIMRMELRGIKIDVNLVKEKIIEGEAVLAETSILLGGFNPASIIDNKKLFIDKLGLPVVTKKRKNKEETSISFDKKTMELYDAILETRDDDTAKLALTYRGWSKSVTSNYRPYLNLLSPDGRLRPGYKLHGTKTGRMSCANPNLQQVPRRGDKPWNGVMKKCFIAKDRYQLWEFDYAQLELRIGAAYAEEKKLTQRSSRRVVMFLMKWPQIWGCHGSIPRH
jgi:DNA polymerase-1